MKHADFVHFVRLSEYACAEQPERYRRNVALFAALGYAWVAACLLVATALLWWAVPRLWGGQVRYTTLAITVGALGLGWSSLRALLVRLDASTEGVRITPEQAPELFKALSRIQGKVKGPDLHEVYIHDDFNASITQRPRWGLLGGSINRLHLGLPLILALDVPRVLAVLAHEYGHLRGGHGRFAAWIYRTRLSWARLHDQLDDDSLATLATRFFLKWYVPRFIAKTFALARQDEYEADRIAAKLFGADAIASALVEINLKARWLDQDFWPSHWHNASRQARPMGPFRAMRHLMLTPPDADFAQEALRQALKRLSEVDDTHPVLKERVEALKRKPVLPVWSSHGAAVLLGAQLKPLVEHFDQQWCREHASAWKKHHARLTRWQEQVQDWRARADTLSTQELVQWANTERQLDRSAQVRHLYELALQRHPGHPRALQGLIIDLEAADRPRKIELLEQLWHAGADQRHWAAEVATQELEAQQSKDGHASPALKTWRQRLKDIQEEDREIWDELSTPPWFDQITRHDLDNAALAPVCEGLLAHQAVTRAWLVCKRLASRPHRRAYLMFVDLPGLNDQQRYSLCRQLEQQIDLPGPALVLWAGEDPTLKDIQRSAFQPIYAR